jgi:hypothetical protein
MATASRSLLRHFSIASSFNSKPPIIAAVASFSSSAVPAGATSSSSSSSSSSPPASTDAAADASSTAPPLPWLARYLNLWEQQSGTREILQLKHNVSISSTAFDAKQREVSRARTHVDRALQAFEQSQSQHARLLQSRDRWTTIEASEFARVLENEVRVRSELDMAKRDLSKLEHDQLEAMHLYMSDLRKRYHEEQLWQDKWRVYSTFGTWGLIVLNTVVFMISQYMARCRESQRMREIQDSIRHSLSTNGGVIQGRHDDEHSMERHALNDERLAVTQKPEQDIAEEVRVPNDADGTDTAVENEDGSHNGIAPSDQTEMESSLLSPLRYWSTLCRFATNTSSRLISAERITTGDLPPAVVRYWSTLCQCANKSSSKVVSAEKMTTVDLPSALLGASITGFAWLVVASSRK